MPHLANGEGAHFYWADYDGFGYWKLTDHDESGLAEGGYVKCEDGEWYDCAFKHTDINSAA